MEIMMENSFFYENVFFDQRRQRKNYQLKTFENGRVTN